MGGERFSSSQTDRELDHLQAVEGAEGRGFAAFDFEREGGARALILALVERPVGMIFRQKIQIPDILDLGVIAQKFGHLRAPTAPASMRSFSVSSERISSHAVCVSPMVPSVERMRRTGASMAFAPEAPPAIRSEWPPTYLVSDITTMSAPWGSGLE